MARYLLIMCIVLVPTLSHSSDQEERRFSMVYKGQVYTNKAEYDEMLRQNCKEFAKFEMATERRANLMFHVPKKTNTSKERGFFKQDNGNADQN